MSSRPVNIAFLSAYPPRECGLAAFTQDLALQLSQNPKAGSPRIVAVSNGSFEYDDNVFMELSQNDRSSYAQTAKELNASGTELLVIEHEYAIYGGQRGEYLLDLVDSLKIPFVSTLHTVLPTPDEKQRHIISVLGQKGQKIITMAKNTVDILINAYGIDPSKIEFISRGVPEMPVNTRESLKAENGCKNRAVVCTFGPLGPGKGLEYGVEAIAKLAKSHRNILYIILGQTSPAVIKASGESYRKSLEALVAKLKIKRNVMFVDRHLTKEENIRYLKLSDICLTPYIGGDKSVSRTLAYAAGCGRVAVSTPYGYAKEMLTKGRGMITRFRDSESIADCIEYVLDHPEIKAQMEQKTLETGKLMLWSHVAEQYDELFVSVLEQYEKPRVTA
jgi:glycosyltransferase involved in cell wall biosynthesis